MHQEHQVQQIEEEAYMHTKGVRRNTWSKDMKNIGRNIYECSICDMPL